MVYKEKYLLKKSLQTTKYTNDIVLYKNILGAAEV